MVGVGPDLVADLLARDDQRRDPDRGEALALLLEIAHVRGGVGELEVADLAEVAVDRLLGDQALDRLVALERVAVERPPGLLAVALDQLARTPLVARMDDPAVAGRGPEAERVRLEQGHRDCRAGRARGRR